MKKKFLLSFFSLLSFLGYSQLALEGFEGPTFPPTDWAVFDIGVGGAVNWSTNLTNQCQGTTAAYMNRQNIAQGVTSEEYLATKSFQVPINGQLRFFSRTFTAGNQGTLYQVKIAPASSPQNVPGSYTLLQQYTEDELSAVFNICDEKVIDLSAYAGTNVYIAFVMVYTQPGTALSGDRWILDNVQAIERCLDPTGLAAAPLATGATLSWTGSATTFEIENILGTGTPTGVATGTSTTTSFSQTGLTPNTNYCYYVRAVCEFSSSAWVGPFCYTTTTLPPVCGGNYVDSGGTTANYPNNANDTVTICPDVPGDVVTVSFTNFNTEAFWDGMYVYNGSVISGATQIASNNPAGNGPLTTPGAFWGNTLPGPFTSSSPDGCLTFVFLSDAFFNNPGWIANVTCGLPPTCPNPNGLSVNGVTSNSATATWTSNSSATTFNLIALPCGSTPPNASTTGYQTSATNIGALLTGLDPDTCYDIYVRDECGPSDFSIWIGVTNVITQPIPPACGGIFTDPGGSNGDYAGSTDYTVTICPDVPGEVVTVTFTEFDTETNWDGLYVFNGNVSGANQISSGNPANNVPGGVPGAFWGNTIPGPFTSSTPDGCLTFRFRSDFSVNFSGWIANVTCGLPPTCPTPNSLTASTITSNSVTLNWTSNSTATTFNMIALPCGSTAPDATTTGYQTSATNIDALLTGLDPDTCYDIYIRDECGPNDFSLWIGPRTITTQIAPPVCGGLFTDLGGSFNNYTSNTDYIVTICPDVPGEIVTVTFTEFDTETNWDGLYVFDGNSIGAPQIASNNPANNVPGGLPGSFWGNTIPGPFSSSSADGCLTFRFRSDGSVNFSGWIANVTCGPPPSCRKPNALTNSDITLTTATFNWNQLPNPDSSTATAWQVLILPAGSPAPDATTPGWVDATSTTFNATGLTEATCYDYYVRAVCSPSDSSLWAGPSSFCTLIPNDDCDGAIDVLTNPDQSCTNFANGSLIGSTPSSQANACAGQPVDDVWFEFTATSANHSVNLNNIVGNQFNLGFAVYSGDCNNLTEIGCFFDIDGTLPGLIIGQTYFIRVFLDSFATNQNITFEVCVGTIPPPIITNDTQYTNVELVEDVLFNSTCASVTNVTTSTGTNFGSVNGIGYFNRNGSTFPFEDGVILSTGDNSRAPGPNTEGLSDGAFGWPGDAQLFNYIQGLGIDPNLQDYNNASILEFDFIPLIDNISFDFIFASEEYGTFQCDFSDAFAFFLTNNSTGVTTNLAIVPNTTTPISVITIRDNTYNAGCASVNPQYFDEFYQLPAGVNPLGAPIDYNGVTVPLTATSPVIPGQQYHIKLVIADRNDTAFDSAVFLEGGSFNFGLELGIDFLIETGNALCAGNTNQLTSDLDPNQYTFVWSNQNGVIDGETGPNLLINQSGTYTLTATLNNTQCSATDTITVEYYDPIVLSTPNNLTACNSSGFAQFTLSNNNASVLGTYPAAQHTVTYHLTQADATAGVNPLPNLYTNVTQFTQTIYARVTNVAGCFGTSQFDLIVQDLTPQFTLTPETTICSGSSGTLSVTPGNFNVNDVTYTWTFNGGPFGGNTSSITVSQAGTYGVTVNNSGCTASATTTVIVNVCEISIYASAVWMQDCTTENDGKFFNTSGTGADLINQDGSTFAMNYGIHVQNSNTLIMRGAELKTQKTASSNVCDATMNYRVFPTGNTPGVFTEWPLPFFSDCNTGTGTFDVGGGPCTTGQQKWQCVSQAGCTPPLDLTTLPPGNYTIQVYYDINGSFNTSTGCADNLTLDNGGNYYVANFTIQAPAAITSTDPLSCNGNNGTITISNLVPNQAYSVTYTDDTAPVGPTTLTSNANGEIVISGLNAGVYANFNFNVNSCNTLLSPSVTLVDPGAPVVTVNNPVICQGGSATVTATPVVPGNYNYVWTVPVGFPDPGNVASFTTSIPGDYTVVITGTNGVNACNLDFESPTVTGQFPSLINENTVSCWGTSASDGIMEFWPSPNYENVPAYSGTQFLEMNANFTSTISQDFTVEPGSTLNIGFAHRGRQGNDTVAVEVGPVGGPYTNLGQFTDGNTAWVLHNLSYLVPNNAGNNYTLRFVSISSAGGSPSVGNYLDAVSVSSVACSSEPTTGTVSLLPSVTLALTSGSAEQNICINTPIETIVYTSVNATDVTVTGLPSGVTGTYADGVLTISGSPTESGTFNYTVTTVGGCNVVTLGGSIIVNPDSTLNLTSGNNTQTVCINTPISDITYSSTNATDVTVTDLPSGVTATYASGTLTISGTPTESGVFTYTVTTTSSCASVSLTGTITVNPNVTLTLTSANENQTVCINTAIASITYLATDATNVTVSGLPNGVTGTYNAGTFTISGTPTETGTFNYTVSTVSTCGSATLTGTLVVNPNVTLALSSGDDTQTLCVNTAITSIVYQSANGATGITVTGLPTGVTGSLAGDLLTISGTPTVTGTFNYTVTTTGGCSSASLTGTIVVNALTTPTFSFGTSITLCPGATPPSLPTSSSTGITGSWSPSTISTSVSGTYTFTPDAGQCATTTTLTVTLQSAFSFAIDGACQGNAFILEPFATENSFDENTSSYSWVYNGTIVGTDFDFNATEYLSDNTSVTLPMVVTLTITTADGCSNTAIYTVTRVFCDIQNGISPNNDGKNEFFDLRLLNVRNLNIYNRYGTVVYSKGNYTNEWKGQSDKGEELPDGTYYYVIEFNDNQAAKTGWIYINREN
ncbi:choice-of-anchor L domain-containing protein [Flavobacterium sp.]|uniref:choice-of-anchor L domain-containing protein n=1 Tax=Flavobacterium sp. TaxID=239 RepID=UPI002B4B12F5|nr:choice-of-anchor L domain-containing protein [Flavobacterium sp.]HLP64568.1 choice-of-anchor L domain-containing protein [Flavobacterium sp.]